MTLTADTLPTEVASQLPDRAARELWARVVNTCLLSGDAQEEAEATAWAGLENAGWQKAGNVYRCTKSLVRITKSTDGAEVITFRLPIVCAVEKAAEGGAPAELKVFGWGSTEIDDEGTLVVDHHADIIEPAEIESAVYAHVESGNAEVDAMHDQEPRGRLIESCFFTPAKRVAMGGDGTGRVAWWAGYRVTDPDTITKVQSGELGEFSIDVLAERHVLDEDQPQAERRAKARKVQTPLGDRPIGRLRKITLRKLSLVDAGAGKGVPVALWKRRDPAPTEDSTTMTIVKNTNPVAPVAKMTLDQALAACPPEAKAAIEAALAAAAQPKTEEPKAPEQSPEMKALARDRDEMAKRLASIEEERAIEKTLASAKADGLEYLPGKDVDTIAKVLRALEGAVTKGALGADVAKAHREMLVAAAKAIKEGGLLKTHGAGGSNDGDSPHLKLLNIAKGLADKDAKLTAAQAFEKACEFNPKLYDEYVEATKAASAR